MDEYGCPNCCFGDKCRDDYLCDYYAPIDELSDTYIDDIIESNRLDFLEYWYQYASEYSD